MEKTNDVLLALLLASSPIIIACVAGIIAALILWKHCSRSAMLTLLSMIFFLVSIASRAYIPIYLVELRESLTPTQISKVAGVVGLVGSITQAVAITLALVATFIDRKKKQ
jgi:hypothetical protein